MTETIAATNKKNPVILFDLPIMLLQMIFCRIRYDFVLLDHSITYFRLNVNNLKWNNL